MSENKRKPKETVYDKLDKNEKAVQIPYYVHEMEMTRLDRINKRLWIILIVIFLAFVGTNAGWIIYENQFETYEVKQEVDNGAGNAYVAGVGDVNYGQSEADNQTAGEEEQLKEPAEGMPNM